MCFKLKKKKKGKTRKKRRKNQNHTVETRITRVARTFVVDKYRYYCYHYYSTPIKRNVLRVGVLREEPL